MLYIKSEFNLVLNVLADDPNIHKGVYNVDFGGNRMELTQDSVLKMCLALSLAIGLVFGGAYYGLNLYNNSIQNEIAEIDSKISRIDQEINAISKPVAIKEEIDMTTYIDAIAQENVTTIKYYDSIATDIPKNVWLTHYYNQTGDKVAIRGVAESIVDIYSCI